VYFLYYFITEMHQQFEYGLLILNFDIDLNLYVVNI
jgi:hypothetical protein